MARKAVKRAPKPPAGTLPIPPASNVENVPSVYINSAEVLSMNQIDVRIAFNEIVVEGKDDIANVRRANIVMSVPHFIALAQMLAENVHKLASQHFVHPDNASPELRMAIEAGRKTS
jgi:hypothetical protein